jgi:hypothetical protein
MIIIYPEDILGAKKPRYSGRGFASSQSEQKTGLVVT